MWVAPVDTTPSKLTSCPCTITDFGALWLFVVSYVPQKYSYLLTYLCCLTFEDGRELPASERPRAAELPQSEFHIEERNADEYEHDGVWYEKRTASVTIAEVREPPDVAQTYRIAIKHHTQVKGFIMSLSEKEHHRKSAQIWLAFRGLDSASLPAHRSYYC